MALTPTTVAMVNKAFPVGRHSRPTQRDNLNGILAFAFGVIFCALLAYAGLRDKPIADEQHFWFLRVLAGLSAAGVAAIIPGFLELSWSISTQVAIRSGGALSVFVLVYAVNPPEIISKVTPDKVASMISNYTLEKYNDAERYADDILRVDPKNSKALNVKGGIAYYNREFDRARELFEQAHHYDPKASIYASNLAYAQIEVGAPELALSTIKTIQDSKTDWYYLLGRAELFNHQYSAAERDLQVVPTSYFHGAARLLQAAAILGEDPKSIAARESASEQLRLAFNQDKEYWENIIDGKKNREEPNIHIPNFTAETGVAR